MTNNEVKDAVIDILLGEFQKKKSGAKINHHTNSYFGKIRKFIGEEVAQLIEEAPEEESTKEVLQEAMTEQFSKQGFIMHAVMYHENFHSTNKVK